MVTTHYNFYVARTCPLILTGAWLLILPMVNTGDNLVSLLTAGPPSSPQLLADKRPTAHSAKTRDGM